ncbi:SAM-dependent methyltransferase [Thermomonospora umbrina]|uniref:S-adenosyl methyltransferase n=1 Tax=Thermomonospora umbrina TaxID=111806 RepID=A0A3D9T4Y7_9ACTN|nr:SAM-dependent methyltransferase [Thermomonospora umbrina]REF00306.1 S-adenosyl methyltransferase [Thermomonospora umbrina]
MRDTPPPGIDTTVPSPARLYDYVLGGRENYAVDRQFAEKLLAQAPELRQTALYNRAFLRRAVTLLADQGVDQFLDIGSGLPTVENTHEVAQRVNPDARIVYVDNDPSVVVHARALMEGQGSVEFVRGDARDVPGILNAPGTRSLIDFERPVAALLVAVLHFVADEEDPARIVADLAGACPPGSHVVLAHATTEDCDPRLQAHIEESYANSPTTTLRLRSRSAIEVMLTKVEPGLVQAHQWRVAEPPDGGPLRVLAGVARVD